MKKVLLLTALLLPLTAGATTMSLSSPATGPGVFASNATDLVPNGSLIRIGTISNLSDPIASFVEFGTGSVKSVGIGATAKPGKVVGSVALTESESAHDKFNNQKIYVWLYNGTSTLTSSQQGLFSTSVNFPLNDGPLGLNDNVTVVSGTDINGVVSIPGWFDAQILPGDANNSKKFVLGGIIPEPTSTTLSGLVALGFLARRKRA